MHGAPRRRVLSGGLGDATSPVQGEVVADTLVRVASTVAAAATESAEADFVPL